MSLRARRHSLCRLGRRFLQFYLLFSHLVRQNLHMRPRRLPSLVSDVPILIFLSKVLTDFDGRDRILEGVMGYEMNVTFIALSDFHAILHVLIVVKVLEGRAEFWLVSPLQNLQSVFGVAKQK